MRKYSVIKNGIITNQWFSDFADENYYEPSWGLPERWLADSVQSPLSEEQKASAIESRTVEEMGQEVVEYKLGAEYEVVIEDISQQVEQESINQEALAYLASTDWMVLRAADGGAPVPEDVRLLRAEARAKIVR